MSTPVMRYEYVQANGVRLWTVTQGEGDPIVLCHGGPGLWDYLEPLGEALSTTSMVHRYDQRGCGRSGSMLPYDVGTMVADLESLRRRWGHERWVVAGHSWGADLALTYTVAFPTRVRGLIYVSGTGLDLDWRDDYRAVQRQRLTFEELLDLGKLWSRVSKGGTIAETTEVAYLRLLWSADFADRQKAKKLVEELLQSRRRPNCEVNRDILEDWRRLLTGGEVKKRARELKVPVLVVHGEGDPRPCRIARRLAETIPGSRLEILPEVGHFPWLEAPESFVALMREFIETLKDRE